MHKILKEFIKLLCLKCVDTIESMKVGYEEKQNFVFCEEIEIATIFIKSNTVISQLSTKSPITKEQSVCGWPNNTPMIIAV